jgi:hypothetical protein
VQNDGLAELKGYIPVELYRSAKETKLQPHQESAVISLTPDARKMLLKDQEANFISEERIKHKIEKREAKEKKAIENGGAFVSAKGKKSATYYKNQIELLKNMQQFWARNASKAIEQADLLEQTTLSQEVPVSKV